MHVGPGVQPVAFSRQMYGNVPEAARLAAGRMVGQAVARADVLDHVAKRDVGTIGVHRFASGFLRELEDIGGRTIGIEASFGLGGTRPNTAADHDGVEHRVGVIKLADHVLVGKVVGEAEVVGKNQDGAPAMNRSVAIYVFGRGRDGLVDVGS